MSILSLDWETRSQVDLKTAGVYVYAEDPSTDILCLAYAFDDEEPQLWLPATGFATAEQALRVHAHITDGQECRAFNAQFERLIWREIAVKRYGFPPVRDSQWFCTAAEAAAMALPRSLDRCASALRLPVQKDSEGYRIMMQLCKPRSILADGTPVWWDDEAKRAKLYAYCQQDVRTERAVYKCVRRLTPTERRVFLLDQQINDRGIAVDRALVLAAQQVVQTGVAKANAELSELTQGQVNAVTNPGALAKWVRSEGVATDGVSKPAVQALLDLTLPEKVRHALQLRVDAGRSSIAKLGSMLEVAGVSGLLRGLLLYHGAGTGRWTGKLVQPQNFPRGEVPNVEQFIPDVLAGGFEVLDLLYPPVVVCLSLLRAMLVPQPGKEFVAGDYSAIEARVLNWLAGQLDVLDNFELYDAGDKSRDPYKMMAVRMGRAASVAEVTKEDRQAGKAAELGAGYQMGAKKFLSAAWDVYQVRVTKEQARDAIKAYRKSHDRVKAFWQEAESACLTAIARPGDVQVFGGLRNLKVVVAGAYLYILLPSGRPLCYAEPRAVERTIVVEDEEGVESRFTKICMEYTGVDSKTKQWTTQRAYGGFLVENIVQAVARDFMVHGMEAVEAAGYEVLLTVHDEVLTQVDLGEGDVKEFESLLTSRVPWGAGCPLAAEAWIGPRYRK